MLRRFAGGGCLALSLLSPLPAEAFLYVGAFGGRSGDLVAVWVKNGFELILDLGPVEELGQGTVASFNVPPEFGGSLSGAKFLALAVPDSQRVYPLPAPAPPQPNVVFTTLADPTLVDPNQIGEAQAHLDSTSGTGWLSLLNAIGPAGSSGGQVIENTDSSLEIATTLASSYTIQLDGSNTDAIGAVPTMPSTAVVIDPQGIGTSYAIPLYEVVQDLTPDQTAFVTKVTGLGTLQGDAGTSGNAVLANEPVPEPDAGVLAAAALATLLGVRRRASRAASTRRPPHASRQPASRSS